MKLTFRCPPGWAAHLPKPVAARTALPEWLRAMPREALSDVLGGETVRTLKQCPPLIDAMSAGVLFPLANDLEMRDGTFHWSGGPPAHPVSRLTRAPIGVHVPEQLVGTPLHDPHAFAVKFTNPWSVTLPEGWSLLIVHPLNREDLPFRTLAGWVDGFSGGMIHFPALWRAPTFEGVLPAGTPVAQGILVRRDTLEIDVGEMDETELAEHAALQDAMAGEAGVYRKRFRRASSGGPDRGESDPPALA